MFTEAGLCTELVSASGSNSIIGNLNISYLEDRRNEVEATAVVGKEAAGTHVRQTVGTFGHFYGLDSALIMPVFRHDYKASGLVL